MAATSLTRPAGDATPPAINPPPGPGDTLLALDLGTTTGWALRPIDGAITSGTVSFRPSRYDGGGMRYLRFRGWLDQLVTDVGGLSAVHFEEVRRHAGTDAAHVYGGLLATLTAWCEQHAVAYQGVPVGTIKRFATGKGNADKAAMLAAMQAAASHPPTTTRRTRSPSCCGRSRRMEACDDARTTSRSALRRNGRARARRQRFTVTIGFYPDGRPGEVFTHGVRSGSNLDALLADACVVVSCLIQHGVEPRNLANSMGRLGNAPNLHRSSERSSISSPPSIPRVPHEMAP